MPRRFLAFSLIALIALIITAACTTDGDARVEVSPTATVTAVATATSSAATGPAPSVTPAPTMAPTVGAETSQPSGERALRHVEELAGRIGTRRAGTEGERQAADYLEAQLRSYGYAVERQPFTFNQFVSRFIELNVGGQALKVAPLTNSSPGSASAEAYFAGKGLEADYPSGGIAGKVALVERGQITFAQKARNAVGAGASAVVIYEPGSAIVSGTLSDTPPGIPVVSIEGIEGEKLRRQIQAGQPVQLSLSFDGGVEDRPAINVIGRSGAGPCEAVVGGHFDTVEHTPGASDNASGTAAMLELARVQALRGNPERACFIAFGAEEEGLKGSLHYVNALSDEERRTIRFMLNFDMVAYGDSWLLIGSRALQEKGQELAAGMGIEAKPQQLVGSSSDHASFIDRRIPALMLHRSEDRLLHTPQDTVDRISAEPLEQAVRLGMAFLSSFASG